MMSMTFYPFNTYQVPGVVWDWWNVQTKGQYAASCLAVMAAVVLYRGLVKLEACFVRYAVSLATTARGTASLQITELGGRLLDLDDEGLGGGGRGQQRRPLSLLSVPLWCRLTQALLSGLLYGYALLLMLVSMSYNPGLFLSLMAGWVVGELVFNTSFDSVAYAMHHQAKAAACCDR